MEHVSMNDGLDGRETVAFGLGAAEVAVFVGCLLSAYATVHAALPAAIAWLGGIVLAAAGAALAWGRWSGRSLLEWTVLMGRFLVRTRGQRAPDGQRGAVVVPLPLRRQPQPRGRREPAGEAPGQPAPHPARRTMAPLLQPRPQQETRTPRIETFFSLSGGTGRTTVAVEVAGALAVQALATRAAGGRAGQVAILDLASRSPAVALRLGLALPIPGGDPGRTAPERLVTHSSGLLVFPGPVEHLPCASAAGAWLAELLGECGQAGARQVIVDIDPDLGDLSLEVLRRAHRVHVTVTASAGGLLDAYRSTAALRQLGIRQLDYIVTRCVGPIDMGEAMADLGGVLIAEIPHDPAQLTAELTHSLASLTGCSPAGAALARLAALLTVSPPGLAGEGVRAHAG